MTIKLSELIELLNKDLGLEYIAMVQYVQHSGLFNGRRVWGHNQGDKDTC